MIIVLNNKSNFDKQEFIIYNNQLEEINTKHTMILCPSTINIPYATYRNYYLGSQNISKYGEGAFTGEVSGNQLYSSDVSYVIIGHSERRELEHETDEDINIKIKRALDSNITPILCIGETKEQRDNNTYKEVLENEIAVATRDLTETDKASLLVAYEPIWSIGTGIIPTVDQIDEVLLTIKDLLPHNKLLYGGSANEKNIDELNNSKYIDGYLLGGLSLKTDKLKEFLQKIKG